MFTITCCLCPCVRTELFLAYHRIFRSFLTQPREKEMIFFLERSLILHKEKRFSYGHLCVLSLEIILYWITLIFYLFWT